MTITKRPICYRCGEQMVDAKEYERNTDQFAEEPKQTHVEHIIHNALFSRLKSSEILCKTCGSEFGKNEDKGFVSLFFPITERIKHIAIPKDHGKGSVNSLKGVLYEDETLQTSKDIYVRERKVIASAPFYEHDPTNKRVIIYANKKRGKQYQEIIEKELTDQGFEITDLTFDVQEDISNKGILGVHFTEGITDFNERFKPGFVKISVGYAMHCGVDRTEIPNALRIDSKGVGNLVNEKNLIPFFPLGPTDALFERNRPTLEDHYPTHTLILFSQQVGTRNHLYCYIDLFSTFQYYVLLNDNYKGEELYKPFYQTVIRQERPKVEVRGLRAKHVAALMMEYGIDYSDYKGNSIEEFYDFAEEKLSKLTFSPVLDLREKLGSSFTKLNTAFILKQISESEISSHFSLLTMDIPEGQGLAFLSEIQNYFNDDDSFKVGPFRRIFLEEGENGIETMSSPMECLHKTITNEARKTYGHMKFNQLSAYIDEHEKKVAQ